MAEPALNNLVEWTVSELSAALKRTVEDAYGFVRVRGEVSGFKGASPSGSITEPELLFASLAGLHHVTEQLCRECPPLRLSSG